MADLTEEITIEDLTRVSLKPGDVLVARVDLYNAVRDEEGKPLILTVLKQAFPKNRVVVVERECDLSVITPHEATAP